MPTTEGGGLRRPGGIGDRLLQQGQHHSVRRRSATISTASCSAANDVANGPQMKKALTDLTATLTSVQEPVQHVDAACARRCSSCRRSSSGLQKTMTSANKLVLSLDSGYGDNTQFNRDLDRLLVQLNDAVRSIRSLADLLARHPEALIKGRPAGGVE